MSRGFVEVPAGALRAHLLGMGFERVAGVSSREEVYRRPSKPDERYVVQVYSTIALGEARACGKDAIRVVGLYDPSMWKADGADARGVAKTARVHRTGSVEGVLARVSSRVEEVEAVIASRLGGITAVQAPDAGRPGVVAQEAIDFAHEAVTRAECVVSVTHPKEDKPMQTRSEARTVASTLPAPGVPVWEVGMNPEQLAAINHQDGPCRLLASAGSGKTRSVVHRIARMVAQGVAAHRILAVTFSKKAADEMDARLDSLRVPGARVGTWHSLCLQILREDATQWASWAIDDKDQAKWVVKEVLGYRKQNVANHPGLDWKQSDLRKVRAGIGICKAHLWEPDSVEAMEYARKEFGASRDPAGRPQFQLFLDTFSASQRIIEEKQLLTFDDMLVFCARHLRSSPEVVARWQGKWDQVIQDEAQDANLAQKTIAQVLSAGHRNYMVVGDTAQSIFSFRGSTPAYLDQFQADWPEAATIVMNRNYRSGSAIVAAANGIIRPATIRLPEDMLAERGSEGRVVVKAVSDHEVEAAELGAWVAESLDAGRSYSDITVLYRLNAQSRAIEEELLKRQIPYTIVGGASFYDRREVKDLLSYLRVAADMDREGDAVKRCLNAPFRYLGAKFVERVQAAASGEGVEWTEVVLQVAEQERIQSRQRESARDWARLIAMVREGIAAEKKPGEILSDLVTATQYIQWVEKEEGQESVESNGGANVREIVRVADKFPSVAALLSYIEKQQAAQKRQRRDKQAGGAKVLLMSIHRSKGLEWPLVWVAGCNEMLLPHRRGDLEEERRLMYVAATRARDELVLSHVGTVATRAGVQRAEPSRFLVEAGLVRGADYAEEGVEVAE